MALNRRLVMKTVSEKASDNTIVVTYQVQDENGNDIAERWSIDTYANTVVDGGIPTTTVLEGTTTDIEVRKGTLESIGAFEESTPGTIVPISIWVITDSEGQAAVAFKRISAASVYVHGGLYMKLERPSDRLKF